MIVRSLPIFAVLALAAAAQSPVYFSVPGADAPELAPRGKYSVGVRTLELINPAQPDILRFDAASGKAPLADRSLRVEIWYPAVIPPGVTEHTDYVTNLAGRAAPPGAFQMPGKALRDAAPLAGEKFPLVIVSHGYPGSRTFLTYLTENLASKGYVVAAIDHTDSVFGGIKPFPSTLLNRSNDQLFTLDTLSARATAAGDFLNGLADPTRAAIVGYSMGGYGALASAGAGYSSKSPINQLVPGGYMAPMTAENPGFAKRLRPNLKAMVAIAPWGQQPPVSAWEPSGLAGIKIPSLFIVGDQDDVSGYEQGVKRAFEGAVNSPRCMLVYENARHNVGGNPAPPGVALTFQQRESYEEPVWRKDRITAINQHFITAFLDLNLKAMPDRAPFLRVAPPRSNDSEWPLAQGASAGAQFSTGAADGKSYWKGFQRRWAVGLRMVCHESGEPRQ